MLKLSTVKGKRIVQKGTIGSSTCVTTFFFCFGQLINLAKYCGLGCSACLSYPVIPHLCVMFAEYRFHSSKYKAPVEENLYKFPIDEKLLYVNYHTYSKTT